MVYRQGRRRRPARASGAASCRRCCRWRTISTASSTHRTLQGRDVPRPGQQHQPGHHLSAHTAVLRSSWSAANPAARSAWPRMAGCSRSPCCFDERAPEPWRALLGLLVLGFPPGRRRVAPAPTKALPVIVGNTPPHISLRTGRTCQDIFLKRIQVDDDRDALVPLNLAVHESLRVAFSLSLLGERPGAMQRYWTERYFHGISPPYTVRSQEAMLRFVADTPGAVGYVAACRVDDRVHVATHYCPCRPTRRAASINCASRTTAKLNSPHRPYTIFAHYRSLRASCTLTNSQFIYKTNIDNNLAWISLSQGTDLVTGLARMTSQSSPFIDTGIDPLLADLSDAIALRHIGAVHPERPMLQASSATSFARNHGAEVSTFYPNLLDFSVAQPASAVVGYRERVPQLCSPNSTWTSRPMNWPRPRWHAGRGASRWSRSAIWPSPIRARRAG